jgi:excisionase family DNA binding protein
MGKITKEEAARILGAKNVRTVERYAAKGRLSVAYEKGTTRDVPMYDAEQVEQLAAELKNPSTPMRPSIEPAESAGRAIATRADSSDLSMSQAVAFNFLEMLSTIVGKAKAQPQADVGAKIMLKITDAAALSSLSSEHLRKAIHAGTLKGKIIGRGFRIKRTDLDAYVKKL